MSEVIELNNHRLLNGDATNRDDVNRLIGDCKVNLLLTDPPYGINIVNTSTGGGGELGKVSPCYKYPSKQFQRERERANGNNWRSKTTNLQQEEQWEHQQDQASKTSNGGGKKYMVKLESPGIVQPRLYKPVIGDNKPFNPQHLLDLNVPSIIFGANNFAHELPNNHKWLVWFKKSSLDFERNNFSDVELCWTNLKGKSCLMYHHSWSGMVREGNRKEELVERVHPTQKPVGLLEQMILEFTDEGDVILDLYGGSGSTLIACEKTNRKCLIMELSTDYCEIIENRYWDYVGKGQTKLM